MLTNIRVTLELTGRRGTKTETQWRPLSQMTSKNVFFFESKPLFFIHGAKHAIIKSEYWHLIIHIKWFSNLLQNQLWLYQCHVAPKLCYFMCIIFSCIITVVGNAYVNQCDEITVHQSHPTSGLLIGDKPLSEPMLTRFTHAYMQQWGEMSFKQTRLLELI